MIYFKKLKYENFLSVGSNPIEIDLNSHRSTLIIGHNGSGKSLMLDALSFALFGKPHRAINKPQLINSINGKKCKVEITFDIGTKSYHIVRGLKPNIFEIWVDGVMINQESHTRDYQKLLETNILKLNHKSFHQIVVLGSGNFVPFMQLPAAQRRGVIEDLLDISIFSKMNTILKENASKLKDQITDATYQLDLIKEKILLQNSHIDKLKRINRDSVDKINQEIAEIQEEVHNLTESNDTLLTQYQTRYGVAQKKVEKLNKEIGRLRTYEAQIKNNIGNFQKESGFYEKTTVCPTCTQDIDEEKRHDKIEECTNKIHSLNEGLTQLQSNLASSLENLEAETRTLNDIIKINGQITTNQRLISNFEKRLHDLLQQKNECSEDKDIIKAEEECNEMYSQRENYSDKKSKLIEDRHYNDVIFELLKDTGIKTKIIRQYLPVMNKLINGYLQILDFFVSFELDENFNESIRSRHRDDFSYASFSEGEKSRIDLSLLFAWRQIAKMKNSSNTNLLIFDEVFDGSLDFDGTDNLLKIMSTLDPETRIFVISHKQEMLEGRLERKIEFERRQNFTKIKNIT